MTSPNLRHIFAIAVLPLLSLAVVMIATDELEDSGIISALANDMMQYAVACLLALALIRLAAYVLVDQIVRNILRIGLAMIGISAVLNVTYHFPALEAWPILGAHSSFNDPIKDACGLLSVVAMLMALVATILMTKAARDDLARKHEQLLAEVAERERSEAERTKLEEQYRQAQKLEAIGQLTGGVAHDFNNLLQVITGYTEVATSVAHDQLVCDALSEIGKAGDRAARLVSQLLLFSRRQIMRPECLDINDVVANLLKMLGRVIGEHIQLEWRPGQRIGITHADRGMVEQTLMNLCVNARDAMPEGGTLTIATRDVTYADDLPGMDERWAKDGRYVLLTVQDTGCGMDEAILEHIFEPFFTTKEAGSGTGLGLATVYGIVKQHAGMIHVASARGQGTTFSLYWPVNESAVAVPEFDRPETRARGGSERILLVEDDEAVRDLARTVLDRAGYTILTACNGAEAVALVERDGKNIDLAILDVVMPQMGGREAYEYMRKLRPGLRVLFASGYSAGGIHTNFVLDSSFNLIQKPFSPASLLHTVRATLDRPSV